MYDSTSQRLPYPFAFSPRSGLSIAIWQVVLLFGFGW